MKRLSSSGTLMGASDTYSEVPDSLVRRVLLVHLGSFQSGDGEISFDDQRLRRVVDANNDRLLALSEDYGGLGVMPMGAFLPILDMHDDESSNDKVVGRLNGLLQYEVLDIPGVGKGIPAVTTTVTFLGRETCQRVLDGRIYHLSIAINEDTELLCEVSTVITPAAPGAMLLSARKLERKKEMAANLKRLKRLGSIEGKLTQLTQTAGTQKEQIRLAANRNSIVTRMSALMQAGKMTPAEFKKQDLKKLSAMSSDAVSALIMGFDSREALIMGGQKGSASSMEVSALSKSMNNDQVKRLKGETLDFFKAKGAKVKKRLSAETAEVEEEPKKEMSAPAAESPSLDDARKLSHAGLEGSEDMGKQLAAMQEQIDALQTVLASVVDEIKGLMVDEESEQKELSAEDSEPKEKSEGEDKADKKEMSEAEDGEKKEMSEGKEEASEPQDENKKENE